MLVQLARLLRSSCRPLRPIPALAVALALGACVAEPQGARYGSGPGGAIPSRPVPLPNASAGRRVALLLPLTGPGAETGQAMLRAAQLNLDRQPGALETDTLDTTGTPEGAARAAKEAIEKGAGIILGPLTAAETAAAAPIATAAGVPMLAFTSDIAQARPGVWTLGVTPAQQARRLVLAMQAENKTRLAAVVPANPFGEALAAGFVASASEARLAEPRVLRAPPSFAGFNDALKDVAAYASRRGAIDGQQRTARASNDADGRSKAAELGRSAPPPPPMDALLLGASGELLGQSAPLLAFYDIGPDQVRILGPATWARDAARYPALAGAWFAAPDPAQRQGFEQAFVAKYNAPPRELASLAYDAAGIARAAQLGGPAWPMGSLARPEGFAGADGLVGLLPDGQVRRGLAIFQVDRGGTHIVQPAPQTLSAPGV